MGKNRLRTWIKRAFNGLMEDALYVDTRDIRRARQRLALSQSVEYVERHLPAVISFDNRYDLYRHFVKFIPRTENGMLCEFGVAGGRSINFLAGLLPDRVWHGFDSFEGLPEDWGIQLPKGAYRQQVPKVASNVKLHAGWFSESLPPFLADNDGMADFLHVDCDLYSSTKTIFELFAPRIQPGTVICFDEFFNYSGWQDGEYKAFMEFAQAGGLDFEYLGYNHRGTQMVVRITSTSAS